MVITIDQINNTVRTYQQALKNNPLTDKERAECVEKIKHLETMKSKLLNKK